jgi:hypothetical protein
VSVQSDFDKPVERVESTAALFLPELLPKLAVIFSIT